MGKKIELNSLKVKIATTAGKKWKAAKKKDSLEVDKTGDEFTMEKDVTEPYWRIYLTSSKKKHYVSYQNERDAIAMEVVAKRDPFPDRCHFYLDLQASGGYTFRSYSSPDKIISLEGKDLLAIDRNSADTDKATRDWQVKSLSEERIFLKCQIQASGINSGIISDGAQSLNKVPVQISSGQNCVWVLLSESVGHYKFRNPTSNLGMCCQKIDGVETLVHGSKLSTFRASDGPAGAMKFAISGRYLNIDETSHLGLTKKDDNDGAQGWIVTLVGIFTKQENCCLRCICCCCDWCCDKACDLFCDVCCDCDD